MRAFSIMYHDVVEDGDFGSSGFPGEGANVYKLRREDFDRHLDAIRVVGRPVGTIGSVGHVGEDAYTTLLTFDDGGTSFHHPIADLLEARGWRGHFFITTGRIGTPGFLTETELRDLKRRGHVIGSHSVSHPTRMSALSRAELDREWSMSIARLSDLLGERVTVASVPGGYYSREVGRSAAAAGITRLFTSEPTAATSVVEGCVVFGRYVVQRDMAPAWSAGFATGNSSYCWRQSALWKAKRIAKALGGSAYLKARQAVLERKS